MKRGIIMKWAVKTAEIQQLQKKVHHVCGYTKRNQSNTDLNGQRHLQQLPQMHIYLPHYVKYVLSANQTILRQRGKRDDIRSVKGTEGQGRERGGEKIPSFLGSRIWHTSELDRERRRERVE